MRQREGLTHALREKESKAVCVLWPQASLVGRGAQFTNLNYRARHIMPPSRSPLHPFTRFGNYGQNSSDATRPSPVQSTTATWRRLHNVLNCATFASCVYYDGGDSDSSSARSCCSAALCLNIHARLCLRSWPFWPGIKFKFMLISYTPSTLWPIICRCKRV